MTNTLAATSFGATSGHVLRISRQQAGQFLCSLDLLAEGEGFEPAVRF
jgi:hypothetical protein